MAKNFHQPLRMCISCRQRDAQNTLVRLQCLNSQFSLYGGSGRSFYACKICLEDSKKIMKSLMRQCRSSDKEKFMNILKEIIVDERKS